MFIAVVVILLGSINAICSMRITAMGGNYFCRCFRQCFTFQNIQSSVRFYIYKKNVINTKEKFRMCSGNDDITGVKEIHKAPDSVCFLGIKSLSHWLLYFETFCLKDFHL
jgi:hypothetical protein